MAIPISSVPETRESAQEIRGRLEEARLKHAKAILAAYELLEELESHGVLDVLRGALGAGGVIVTKLATAANSEESVNAIRNVVSLARIFGSIDPDVLHRLADELTRVKPDQRPVPEPKLWSAIKIFASKDSRRAMVGSAAFLQAFGRALVSNKAKA